MTTGPDNPSRGKYSWWFGRVHLPWWNDRPLWIVGGGPSLRGRNLSRLRERGRVLGVNRAADMIPCDATFSIDRYFIKERAASLGRWAAAGQEVYLAVAEDWFTHTRPIPGVIYLRRVRGRSVREDPTEIANSLNSGYGALCLALKKKAREIYLLGFDLHDSGGHWHDGYSWENGSSRIYFGRWADRFEEIASSLPEGIRVYNCNPRSRVRAFPCIPYEEVGL